MRRWGGTTLFVYFVLVSSLFGIVDIVSEEVSAYTPHDPITIDGRNDFTTANGVTGGNGTPADPYIIENWEIIPTTGFGISISNSNAHFIVRNVYVHSSTSFYYGITLTGVYNGGIEGVVIESPDYPIVLQLSGNNLISGCTLTSNGWTIQVIDSDNNTITGNQLLGASQYDILLTGSHFNLISHNTLSGYRHGISLSGSHNNTVIHNAIPGGSWPMSLTESLRNTIAHNTISGGECIGYYDTENFLSENVISGNLLTECNLGLYVQGLHHSIISHNTILNGAQAMDISKSDDNKIHQNIIINNSCGINLYQANDNEVWNNDLTSNLHGIMLRASDPNVVYHNNVVNNIFQADDDDSMINLWDAGYPTGGNYWSDYAGPDNCSGPNQDVCPDPDGIGDFEYNVTGTRKDNYPLMNPYTSSPPSPPSEPRNLQTNAGIENITLVWDPPSTDGGSPINSYQIYRGTVPVGETFLQEVGNFHTFIDNGLTSGMTYYYQVSAVNVVGEGLRSDESHATVASGPGPNPHDPIHIYGDDELKYSDAVSGGSGSSLDPYVIENWEIDASTGDGINISYVTYCFKIRNVHIYGGGSNFFGISIYYSYCSWIENVTTEGNRAGIYLNRAAVIVDRSNIISNVGEGVYSFEASARVNATDISFNGGHGFSAVFDWMGFIIENSRIVSNGGAGIGIGADDVIIRNNNISLNTWHGIHSDFGHDSSIIGNSIFNNGGHGINSFAYKLPIENNTITRNNVGIESSGDKSRFANNTLLGNRIGINSWSNSGSTFVDNLVESSEVDILLEGAYDSTLHNNEMGGFGILISGWQLANWNSHTIDTSNIVRGRPVYYWKDAVGGTVPTGAAQVILANCTGVEVENQDLTEVHTGILLAHSSANVLANNSVLNSYQGINLKSSNDNLIRNNSLSSNSYGIKTDDSNANNIYHNGFFHNGYQAYESPRTNIWDDGYPSGGNYWSDYTGIDNCSGPNQDVCPDPDGIGDTPYEVNFENEDRYPLIEPFGMGRPRPPAALSAVLGGSGLGDVILSWVLSPDDGGGIDSVSEYRVYRGTIYSPDGSDYSLVATLSGGMSEFVDALAGEGDSSNYFYQVCAVDVRSEESCALNHAGKFTVSLSKGPNLLSIPLIQVNEDVETVLQTLSLENAWFYDSATKEWSSLSKSKPYGGGFRTINHLVGIRVDLLEASSFTIAGVVPIATDIQLLAGWNLVGFPTFKAAYSVADLRAESVVKRVECLDPSTPPYFLREIGDEETLQPGRGYWLLVESDRIWTINGS